MVFRVRRDGPAPLVNARRDKGPLAGNGGASTPLSLAQTLTTGDQKKKERKNANLNQGKEASDMPQIPPEYDVFFKVKPPHRVTAKAYGFWPTHGDARDLVWVPKSHCRLIERHDGCTLFVADWLEAKNSLSTRIA